MRGDGVTNPWILTISVRKRLHTPLHTHTHTVFRGDTLIEIVFPDSFTLFSCYQKYHIQ